MLALVPALHLATRIHAQSDSLVPPLSTSGSASSRPGDRWGRIAIPRVGLDFIVFEGASETILRKGPGHVPGTATPDSGNCVIVGHRDSFFRRLSAARRGDIVQVRRANDTSSYRLESRRIVRPEDLSALLPTRDRRLTLITCFPFGWIGAAPYRLIWDAVPVASTRHPGGSGQP